MINMTPFTISQQMQTQFIIKEEQIQLANPLCPSQNFIQELFQSQHNSELLKQSKNKMEIQDKKEYFSQRINIQVPQTIQTRCSYSSIPQKHCNSTNQLNQKRASYKLILPNLKDRIKIIPNYPLYNNQSTQMSDDQLTTATTNNTQSPLNSPVGNISHQIINNSKKNTLGQIKLEEIYGENNNQKSKEMFQIQQQQQQQMLLNYLQTQQKQQQQQLLYSTHIPEQRHFNNSQNQKNQKQQQFQNQNYQNLQQSTTQNDGNFKNSDINNKNNNNSNNNNMKKEEYNINEYEISRTEVKQKRKYKLKTPRSVNIRDANLCLKVDQPIDTSIWKMKIKPHTGHVPTNFMNIIIPHLLKLWKYKIPCRKGNLEKLENQCDCDVCNEFQMIRQMKRNTRNVNLKAFKQLWSSDRIRMCSLDYLNNRAITEILDKPGYRNPVTKISLLLCLKKFQQAVQDPTTFYKLLN